MGLILEKHDPDSDQTPWSRSGFSEITHGHKKQDKTGGYSQKEGISQHNVKVSGRIIHQYYPDRRQGWFLVKYIGILWHWSQLRFHQYCHNTKISLQLNCIRIWNITWKVCWHGHCQRTIKGGLTPGTNFTHYLTIYCTYSRKYYFVGLKELSTKIVINAKK